MPKRAKSYIPTVATICNLCAGFMAIALAMEGEPYLAALLIISAVLLDSLDGVLARALRASSQFGTELDSLADMVSFGVAPAVLVGSVLPDPIVVVGWMMLAIFPLCTAIRLARFNVRKMHSSSHGSFVGLASTGAGGCVASAVLVHGVLMEHGVDVGVEFLPWLLLLLGFLMISTFSYPHVRSLLVRVPLPSLTVALAVLLFAAAYWEYELVFLALFWGYAASGPALAVGEKVKAVHGAHSG